MVSAHPPTTDQGRAVKPCQGSSQEVLALHSTALKWSSDGELSALDLHRIVARLADTDPVARELDVSHFGLLQRERA